MYKSIIKIAAATRFFARIHSLLVSRRAKEKATDLLGERARNGLYPSLYNGLAIATFGESTLYSMKLPNRELYRVRSPHSWLMHSIQFFFLLYLLSGAREIGFLRFAGIPNLAALLTGQQFTPVEPEGHGPIHKTQSDARPARRHPKTTSGNNYAMLEKRP